jgi:hypothetical protein
MRFVIDENYRIASDRNQWMIQRSRRRKGKAVWEGFAYFSTLDACVQRLRQMLCRELDTEGVADALAGIDAVSNKLSAALSPDFEVVKRLNSENRQFAGLAPKVATPACPKPYR